MSGPGKNFIRLGVPIPRQAVAELHAALKNAEQQDLACEYARITARALVTLLAAMTDDDEGTP